MATSGDDLTHEDRMLAGQRAIWREVRGARIAVQWLLAIQLIFIALGIILSLAAAIRVG